MGRGFPAPRVLQVLSPGELLDLPVQVMERVPGVTMLDAIKRRPWQVGALVDRLAALHGWSQIAMLHGGAFDGESSSVGMPARVPLELADWLRHRFESDLAAR